MAKVVEQYCVVIVDYPRKNEKVTSRDYTIRIGANPPSSHSYKVEIAINEEEWHVCREAGGYWWYDWTGYGPGEHQVIARIHAKDGRIILSEPRRFKVEFEGHRYAA